MNCLVLICRNRYSEPVRLSFRVKPLLAEKVLAMPSKQILCRNVLELLNLNIREETLPCNCHFEFSDTKGASLR
jgi:hypothetical protein